MYAQLHLDIGMMSNAHKGPWIDLIPFVLRTRHEQCVQNQSSLNVFVQKYLEISVPLSQPLKIQYQCKERRPDETELHWSCNLSDTDRLSCCREAQELVLTAALLSMQKTMVGTASIKLHPFLALEC